MTDNQKSKVAVVTGSAHGIGREIALRLAADGASVVVNCLTDVDAGNEVVSAIKARGGRAVLVQADVGKGAQMRSLFETAEREFGGLDIFIHNAATIVYVPICEASDEDYELLFALHSRATFIGFREAARRVRDGGRLIFISSGVTLNGGPPKQGLYAASKAAGEAMVRPFANELGPRNVTVNAVLVGVTRTRNIKGFPETVLAGIAAATPLRRLGEPEDLADVVGFLASEQSRWITGQCIQATGGLA